MSSRALETKGQAEYGRARRKRRNERVRGGSGTRVYNGTAGGVQLVSSISS